jgi:diguanylate cyclase (GGDEF)-like protein
VRGLPEQDTRDGVSPLADVENLVIEGRYGRADLALRRLEALIPGLAPAADTETLLLALYGRALLLRQLKAGTQNEIAACDVLERAAHEREAELWVATACATRARFRVDSGDIGGATADLARADAEAATGDLTADTGYRLLDGLSLVYSSLRLHDRADEMRARIEHSIGARRVLDQAQHWATWSGELAARAMEPLALGGEVQDPQLELMGRAIEIAAKLDGLPENDVPSTLRRGARGVRALSAAYRGRPSEALRLLGPDAFGTVADLPMVERQIVSLAAMRAHALVGSLATARSLDDAAADTAPTTLPNLVLEVCRTRERLWLETYAGGDVIPVLHRMTELLVRLGWRGMDLLADTARQALEHQALRTESRTDALTGVGNRRALDEELRQLLRFGPLPLSLILVDIDHFKGVNDVFTHVVGDEVLKRVAASLSLQLRTDDQLLRYGGDEFVVLLPGTGDEEADAVAERMRAAVSGRAWSELAEGLHVSITTGVAAVWSLSGRRPDADAEKLFRRADERLLEGKRNRPEGVDDRSRSAGPDAGIPANRKALTDRPELTARGEEPTRPDPKPGTNDEETARKAAAALFGPARAIGSGSVSSVPASGRSDWPGSEDDSFASPAPWSSRSESGNPGNPDDDEAHDDSDVDEPMPAAPAAWQLPTSTPARSRSANRAERPRSPFDLGPEDEEPRAETPLSEPSAPRPGGRRDIRPRAIDSGAERSAVAPVAPIRSRREARAANRPDVDAWAETSAGRDAAEAEAAAREVSQGQADDARQRIAREARAREDAARDAEYRRSEQEKADREAEAQERLAQEWLVRDRAARDQALRQAAEAEAREKAAREKAQREIEAEAEAREKAAREQAARLAAEAEAREKAARERAAQEQAAREAAEQAAREAAAEAARKAAENAAREAAETAAREAAEQAAREAAELERRRAAERARAERERREAEARERERREAAARADRERREAEARERERHEAAVKVERERREAENRARLEREQMLRERLEQERLVKERQAQERLEREQREAAAREAERLRQEAREREAAQAQARAAAQQRAEAEAEARVVAIEQARMRAEAEAERARAADRIREEAYARDVENARQASGSNQKLTSIPSFDQISAYQKPDAYQNPDPATAPIAAVHPLQRRSPLYDASSRADEGQPFHERRSHPRPGSSQSRNGQNGVQPNGTYPQTGPNGLGLNQNAIGPGPKALGPKSLGPKALGPNGLGPNGVNPNDPIQDDDQDSADTIALRTRRNQPLGPPTRSQAIIDLSARKRPRSPYKGDR